jgi:hypothetical protein
MRMAAITALSCALFEMSCGLGPTVSRSPDPPLAPPVLSTQENCPPPITTPGNSGLFVSPCGNDSNPGTVGLPFRTLARARDVLRTMATKPTVYLRGGTYELDSTLAFTAVDSGSYLAFDDEKPVISGGRPVSGWQRTVKVPVGTGSVDAWEAHVAFPFHDLYIDGARMTRARLPRDGFFHVDGSVDYHDPVSFHFHDGEMSPEWIGAEVVLLQAWGESRLPITSVDPGTHTVILANDLLPWMIEPNARYWVEETKDDLAPGEWFLDQSTLYYLGFPGEDVASEHVIAPRLEQLVTFDAAHDLTLDGLAFAYTDWSVPAIGYRDVQTAFDVPAAIEGHNAQRVTISHSHFSHLGQWASDFNRGSRQIVLQANEMEDLGAGGIKLGEGCTDTLANPNAAVARIENCAADLLASSDDAVLDNRIHDIGKVYIAAAGLWVGQAAKTRVCSNEIFDTNESGISLGWTWGFGRSFAHDNLVAFNHIHDVGRGLLSDMGGIYTLGIQPGTIIRNNVVHDIAGFLYGGWGIYQDQGSSQILTENNTVYRAHSGAFVHNSDGQDNLVRNNIFALADAGQIVYSDNPVSQRPADDKNITFERNIVYWNGGPLLGGGNWSDSYSLFDGNLYFNVDGSKPVVNDSKGVVADPLFRNPQAGDFSLSPGSPAENLGFSPIEPAPATNLCN